MVTIFAEENLKLLEGLPLCCPQCKGSILQKKERFLCNVCKRQFPVIAGIPDFRIFGDPYLNFEDDYKRAQLIAENAPKFNFQELLKFYWSHSPETPPPLREKFVRTALLAEAKAEGILKELALFSEDLIKIDQNVLEIGCGTGGFLVSAVKTYSHVIGIDIALRWLIVARKRLEESGKKVPLICCCAEYLPFPDGFFNLVVTAATLEHTRDQSRVISESYRVLQDRGILFLSTPNRYSLTVEPHVYLWGVGFLPRSWMHRYVYLLKGVNYKNYRLLSYFELKKLLNPVFSKVKFSLPDVDNTMLINFSRWKRFQVSVYRKLRKVSLFRAFFLLCGPMYHIIGQKTS